MQARALTALLVAGSALGNQTRSTPAATRTGAARSFAAIGPGP
jgi:hypothetical protein